MRVCVVLVAALVCTGVAGGTAQQPPTSLVFTRCCGKDSGSYLADIRTGGARKMPDNVWAAVWSPDGRKVAAGFPGRKRCWLQVVDLRSGRRTTLKKNCAMNGVPDWSPDGSRLAYSMREKLYVVPSNGRTPPGRITSGLNDGFPRWSPDGRRIAYRALVASTRNPHISNVGQILTIAPDGSDPRPLTTLVTDFDQTHAADWSPDGTRIVFESTRDEYLGFYIGELYVMNVDGSDVRRLTFSPGWDGHPAWSPDGSMIAFTSWRDGGKEPDIYVMNADGSDQRRVAEDGRHPQWVPRGAKLTIPKPR